MPKAQIATLISFSIPTEADPDLSCTTALLKDEYANSDGSDKQRKAIAQKAKCNYLQGDRILNGHTMRQTTLRPAGTDFLPSEVEGADQTITMDSPEGSYTLCFKKTH